MWRRCCLVTLVLVMAVGRESSRAQGQTAGGASARQAAPAAGFHNSNSYQLTTGTNNAALNFYGRPKSVQYSQVPRALPLPQPLPAPAQSVTKPFSGVRQASTISPYLALDNLETSTSLPNYFLFVRPQLDQRARQRAQQAQSWRLKQQVNAAAASAESGYSASGTAVTGHTTQFMNSGGYYPGLR